MIFHLCEACASVAGSGAPEAIASCNAIKLLIAELHALRFGKRNQLIGGLAGFYLGLLLISQVVNSMSVSSLSVCGSSCQVGNSFITEMCAIALSCSMVENKRLYSGHELGRGMHCFSAKRGECA